MSLILDLSICKINPISSLNNTSFNKLSSFTKESKLILIPVLAVKANSQIADTRPPSETSCSASIDPSLIKD